MSYFIYAFLDTPNVPLWAELCRLKKFLCWSFNSQLPKNVIVFGDKAFIEVIKLEWGH